MGVKIEKKWPKDFGARLERELRFQVKTELEKLGVKAQTEARTAGSYTDQTGNLRSSIGFGYYEDGKLAGSGEFEIVKEGREGKAKGHELIASEKMKDDETFGLVVCAGMEYASDVEHGGAHREPKNVLESAKLLVERDFENAMKTAASKTIKQAKKWK